MDTAHGSNLRQAGLTNNEINRRSVRPGIKTGRKLSSAHPELVEEFLGFDAR